MLKKIYPVDQVEKYLLIDLIAGTYLLYRVLLSDSSIHFVFKLLLLILFLGTYYICLWHRDERLVLGSIVGCMTLVALSLYIDEWILLYGFVYADLLGRASRKWMIGTGMLGILGMFLIFDWLKIGDPFARLDTYNVLVIIAQLATPVVISVRLKSRLLKEKLELANAQLERYIQEEERSRIARDLHDSLGQTLTMIKLKSELALKLVDKRPVDARAQINDILDTSRYALKQVRELVTDMKFVSLEQEIEASRAILQKAGIELIVINKGTQTMMTSVAETMLALSLREAITNMIKHSDAKKCTITQEEQDNHIYVHVSDDGNGRLKEGEGNGIQSMRERMRMLQGSLQFSSHPDSGTTIIFQVPLVRNGGVEHT